MDVEEIHERLMAKWTSPNGKTLIDTGGPLVAKLMEGEPVAPDDAATLMGWPGEDALARWRDMGYPLELDEDGNVIGAGLSLRPTRHVCTIAGRDQYGWCAMDAIMFALVAGEPSPVRSTCPATGRAITLTVTPTGIVDADPPTTVVSLAPPEGDDIRRVFCDRVNFYATREDAVAHTKHDPEIAIADLDTAFRIGKDLAALFPQAD
jgi:alkylmercury lyase